MGVGRLPRAHEKVRFKPKRGRVFCSHGGSPEKSKTRTLRVGWWQRLCNRKSDLNHHPHNRTIAPSRRLLVLVKYKKRTRDL